MTIYFPRLENRDIERLKERFSDQMFKTKPQSVQTPNIYEVRYHTIDKDVLFMTYSRESLRLEGAAITPFSNEVKKEIRNRLREIKSIDKLFESDEILEL